MVSGELRPMSGLKVRQEPERCGASTWSSAGIFTGERGLEEGPLFWLQSFKTIIKESFCPQKVRYDRRQFTCF